MARRSALFLFFAPTNQISFLTHASITLRLRLSLRMETGVSILKQSIIGNAREMAFELFQIIILYEQLQFCPHMRTNIEEQ
jgi:hypothetical protein